jgi:hypothetical protein
MKSFRKVFLRHLHILSVVYMVVHVQLPGMYGKGLSFSQRLRDPDRPVLSFHHKPRFRLVGGSDLFVHQRRPHTPGIHKDPGTVSPGGRLPVPAQQMKIPLSGQLPEAIRPGSHPDVFSQARIPEDLDLPGTQNPHPLSGLQIIHSHAQIFRMECTAVLKRIENPCQRHLPVLIHFCQAHSGIIFIHIFISPVSSVSSIIIAKLLKIHLDFLHMKEKKQTEARQQNFQPFTDLQPFLSGNNICQKDN